MNVPNMIAVRPSLCSIDGDGDQRTEGPITNGGKEVGEATFGRGSAGGEFVAQKREEGEGGEGSEGIEGSGDARATRGTKHVFFMSMVTVQLGGSLLLHLREGTPREM